MIYKLKREMIEYFSGDPKRIMHFLKVHSLAKTIGVMENFGEWDMLILEAAALTHDIGIKPAEAQYGRCDGKLQEELGPGEAKPILKRIGFSSEDINKICGIIARHHSYEELVNIKDHALQALVEADLLVNLQEEGASAEAVRDTYKNIFRTSAGQELCREIFGLKDI